MLAMSQETREEFLTAQEAADVARVTIKTIYRWTAQGLRTYRPGGHGHYRILKSDLMDYLNAMKGVSVVTDAQVNHVHPSENYVAPLLNQNKSKSRSNQ